MKYLKEVTIIFAVTAVGECLYAFLPLPIPASIYGLCLMLLLLFSGMVKVEQVEDSGRFLIEIMPVMFIPPAVGLLATWEDLVPVLLPVLLIIFVTTCLVMIVTGKVTEFFMNKGEKK
ncbi:MAG: CidA/LrgA family protein [Eubacteriales bacterium]